MGKDREISCYDYVNHPYERVSQTLRQHALRVFQSATKAASARAQTVAAELHVDVAGVGVKTDITIAVKGIQETADSSGPTTRLVLEWEAAKMPRLFPLMRGELAVFPLTSTETQLAFSGIYEPPLGAVGKTINAVAGHRIAEASVHRFVDDVAAYLRETLT